MNNIIKTLQYKYALSESGAKDMVRAFAACTFSDLVLMIPAGLLYQFIDTVYTADAPISGSQILFLRDRHFGMPGTDLPVHLHPV